MLRKNSIFLVALLTALTLTATLAPTALAKNSKPPPAQYNGPPISGLRASAADFSGETPGIGTIDKATCTDGTDLGGGNIRINCDAIDLPHNEMSITVDPANPNHIVAGSNDYELFFQGGSVVQRIIAGYYTSFDGGNDYPINVDGRQTLTNSQFRVNSAGNLAVDPSSGPSQGSTVLYISFSD